jgi:trans-2,3-dihydro-3-hydroxyanthranilate isomerase
MSERPLAERRAHRYRVVDVFTETPLEGNPVAVFPASADLDPVVMQAIARELNLAETVFVCPATREGCAARLRIFTPTREMEFAGHPTVGASWVLQAERIVAPESERFSLDEGVGAIPIRIERGAPPLIWLRTPPVRAGQRYEPALCAKLLGLDAGDLLDLPPQWLSAGNPIAVIGVKSTEAVDRAWLDRAGQQVLQGPDGVPVCAYVFTPAPSGAYGRMFAPMHGVPEDPATGSAMGPLATFMMQHGLVVRGARFRCEQGAKMGRRSILHVQIGAGETAPIDVGGSVTPVTEAAMTL